MGAGWRKWSAVGSVALLVGVLAGLCSLGRWGPADGPLDGRWRVVGGSNSGILLPAWMARSRRITFTFAGDRATVVGLYGEGPLSCSVAFPSPNALDLAIDAPALRVSGIYARDGDRLRLCLNNSGGARPPAFATRRGDPCMDFRLERVTPGPTPRTPADELAAIVALGRSAGADRAALAERCLRLAESAPNADEATVALFWAVCNAPDHRPALARLKEGLSRADLTMIGGCLGLDRDAWVGPGSLPDGAVRDLIPLLLDRVRRTPDHPRAGEVLTWVCCMVGEGSGPPTAFAEAARLIDGHAADSPDLFNVFFYLGVGRQPPWMGEHEAMARRVAARNPHGHVRAGAAFALATIVAESGDARQDEARDLYLRFVKEFEGGGGEPAWADLVGDLVTQARQEAEAMLLRPLGGPAPPLEGVDLDGKPLRLADYRGKVVLLSFWATWCGPCLRLLPRERELHDRMAGKPFALVGVNGDRIEKLDRAALAKHPIAWPSFRSARPGRKSIAQEWRVWGWPTLYLIDHEGVIRRRWSGTPTTGELEHEVERLVARAMNRPEPAPKVIPPRASGGKAAGGFVERVFREVGEESKYAVWVPDGYDPKTPLPVVLFLHGSGQRGADGKRPLGIGLGPALRREARIPPFLAVFPQAKGNWKADGADARRALAILDEVQRDYAVDRRRVYLTGVSMGAEGVWDIAAAHPGRFAAIVPVCGGGDPAAAGRIKDVPCWAFHGDADRVVPVRVTRAMVKALTEAGGRPLYQEYPGVDHDCWDRAYGDPELYRWLLEQRTVKK